MKNGSQTLRITPQLAKRSRAVFETLRGAYPDARCELNFSNPLELAIGAILSAQCTDKRVNMVTPALFKKYRTASDWAAASQEALEEEIRSTGFFRNKTKSIRALGAALVEQHGGTLPNELEALVALPGIGRKTANLLLADAFDKPGITVDTHCKRVSFRLGLTRHKDPDKVEFDLKALIPEDGWITFSHCMVFHGRYCCHARKPSCASCPVRDDCPSADMSS